MQYLVITCTFCWLAITLTGNTLFLGGSVSCKFEPNAITLTSIFRKNQILYGSKWPERNIWVNAWSYSLFNSILKKKSITPPSCFSTPPF